MGNKATEKDLNEALNAGYDSNERYVFADDEVHGNAEDTSSNVNAKHLSSSESNSDDEGVGTSGVLDNVDTSSGTKDEEKNAAPDEWRGISDSIKSKFDKMASDLDRVTNIANSASGRANKLQSEIQKKQAAPEPVALTSDKILEAMTSKEKRDTLREEWPEFANVFDEMDKSVSSAVGTAMDAKFGEFKNEMSTYNSGMQESYQVQRSLDISHPGWETTVNTTEFKDWVYKNGPNAQEQANYEGLLNQAANATTKQDAAASSNRASAYYNDLLGIYPVWAGEKGSLYGDPSGTAAIKLLDMHKEVRVIPSEDTNTKTGSNKQRLEANIAPTSGNSRQATLDDNANVHDAFLQGFSS